MWMSSMTSGVKIRLCPSWWALVSSAMGASYRTSLRSLGSSVS